MTRWIAITRAVSSSIADCELTFLERIPIDLENARRQHHAYEAALRSMGVEVMSLPEEPHLPDAVFVEDVAILLDECAVLTRPGAESRRPEFGIHLPGTGALPGTAKHPGSWHGRWRRCSCGWQAGFRRNVQPLEPICN